MYRCRPDEGRIVHVAAIEVLQVSGSYYAPILCFEALLTEIIIYAHLIRELCSVFFSK